MDTENIVVCRFSPKNKRVIEIYSIDSIVVGGKTKLFVGDRQFDTLNEVAEFLFGSMKSGDEHTFYFARSETNSNGIVYTTHREMIHVKMLESSSTEEHETGD